MDATTAKLFEDVSAAQQDGFAKSGTVKRAVDAVEIAVANLRKAVEADDLAESLVYVATEKLRAEVDGLVRPTPTPPVEPPVTPPAADPNAMPRTTPSGMKLLMEEDFLTDIPRGGVRAALKAKGWEFYDGFKDTKKVGLYATDRTSLTKGGNLQLDIRMEAGQPLAWCGLPTGWKGQLGARYEVRYRADVVPGYKIAWLLWPQSGVWKEGEVDFPEHALGGNISGFGHEVNGDPNKNAVWVHTSADSEQWHTAVIDWKPGSHLDFILDGKVEMHTTKASAIPVTPMRWTLQCETNLEGTAISPTAAGKIEIAYVRVHVPA